MTQLAIQFLIRFVPDVNTPVRRREFSEGLFRYIKEEESLQCLWGGQGGKATVYGVVYREVAVPNISLADREKIVDWIRRQRIDCTATFGDPEPFDSYDLMRDLTELAFEVRNLTDEDRNEGLAHRDSVLKRIEAAGGKVTEPE
ncbi:MAG: hypothetical protein KDA80_21330 [Planctomycetaceae bacterium]|nr:hypothetical protein [Planctomycetaceae bacterium]